MKRSAVEIPVAKRFMKFFDKIRMSSWTKERFVEACDVMNAWYDELERGGYGIRAKNGTFFVFECSIVYKLIGLEDWWIYDAENSEGVRNFVSRVLYLEN